jgi:hypothetical protein
MATMPGAMTWETLYAMASSVRRNQTIDTTLFTEVLNDIRMEIESERDWEFLRKSDQSQMWNPGDTWQTPKTLPADFVRWIEDDPVILWDGNTNPGSLVEQVTIIGYDQLLWFNSDSNTMAVDYPNNQFYFGGTTTQAFIVVLNYLKDSGEILPASGNTSYSWAFPARYHKRLAYEVVHSYRLGVDYDQLAAANAVGNKASADAAKKAMMRWDANLKRQRLRNRDYYPQDYPNFVNRKINMQGY